MTDLDEATVRARVAEIERWRHRIPVGAGVVTPGAEDTARQLELLQIPRDLTGQRVLDIGCSDGFYAFTCEERGASEVVAIDDESSTLQVPNGLRVARELRGSAVAYEARDVQALAPDVDGHFDTVLFINVLYHLPNPMLALQRIAAVTRPGGLLVLKTYFRTDVRAWVKGRCLGFDVDPRPKWWYFPGTELGGDPTNWWAPNRRGLDGMLGATGWTGIRQVARAGDRLYYHARRAA